ncbi:hypothetical protein Q5P01_004574 [Channa striata]|uniref:Uncharacterized protein n=1 Tax=Channa striata TaxID=64152 RepID=A0AA88NBG1_CHASR|nr:hypothetical protein Q5P01_004574 [Channa striata]
MPCPIHPKCRLSFLPAGTFYLLHTAHLDSGVRACGSRLSRCSSPQLHLVDREMSPVPAPSSTCPQCVSCTSPPVNLMLQFILRRHISFSWGNNACLLLEYYGSSPAQDDCGVCCMN